MPKRQSRLSQKQQEILDKLLRERFRGRWWGPPGGPARRLYLKRLNRRNLTIVDPAKVYIDFEKPQELLGARLVVGRASRRRHLSEEEAEQQRELVIAYARATYIAKTYDSVEAMFEYAKECAALSIPTGEPDR